MRYVDWLPCRCSLGTVANVLLLEGVRIVFKLLRPRQFEQDDTLLQKQGVHQHLLHFYCEFFRTCYWCMRLVPAKLLVWNYMVDHVGVA